MWRMIMGSSDGFGFHNNKEDLGENRSQEQPSHAPQKKKIE